MPIEHSRGRRSSGLRAAATVGELKGGQFVMTVGPEPCRTMLRPRVVTILIAVLGTGGIQMKISPYDAADGLGDRAARAGPRQRRGDVEHRRGRSVKPAPRFAKRAPIVVIDQATGRRQLIWAELNATPPARRPPTW